MPAQRSYLFVPGDRPDRFEKAWACGAHAMIVDLEDAVAPDEKAAARQHVRNCFVIGRTGVVRMNALGTPWADDDLSMLANLPSARVMVPKACAESLSTVAARLPGRPLIALIETVQGYMELEEVVRTDGVSRLAFGNLDFAVDARIPGGGAFLDPVRFALVTWSRAANLPPPIDGVTVELSDPNQLAADIARAKAQGMAGKLCIHPSQVAPVNAGFAPASDEVEWAQRIVAALEAEGGGVVQLDGKMIDRPVIDRAKAILADAG